jgi:hypothetical protein
MAHNENYDFEAQTPIGHKQAFIRRFGVYRILLRGGEELYKLTENPLVDDKQRITPWWSLANTTKVRLDDGRCIVVEGRAAILARSKGLATTEEAFTRSRSAVTQQWNSMSGVLRVRLNVDAYGWFGRCAAQMKSKPEHADNAEESKEAAKVVWIGGAYQVYIPCLGPGLLTEL